MKTKLSVDERNLQAVALAVYLHKDGKPDGEGLTVDEVWERSLEIGRRLEEIDEEFHFLGNGVFEGFLRDLLLGAILQEVNPEEELDMNLRYRITWYGESQLEQWRSSYPWLEEVN